MIECMMHAVRKDICTCRKLLMPRFGNKCELIVFEKLQPFSFCHCPLHTQKQTNKQTKKYFLFYHHHHHHQVFGAYYMSHNEISNLSSHRHNIVFLTEYRLALFFLLLLRSDTDQTFTEGFLQSCALIRDLINTITDLI